MIWRRRKGPAPRDGPRYEHLSDRDDWDAVNRELYAQVIETWPGNALALISNTQRNRTGLARPFLRIAPQVAPEVREALRRFGNEDLERVFAMARDRHPEVSDCYRTRHLGLPDNSLVYLAEHRTRGHRTVLVFGGPYLRRKLDERIARAGRILAAPEPAPATAGRDAAPAPAPGGDPVRGSASLGDRRALARAALGDLQAREAYLEERLGGLSYRERVELEKVQAELRRRSHAPR